MSYNNISNTDKQFILCTFFEGVPEVLDQSLRRVIGIHLRKTSPMLNAFKYILKHYQNLLSFKSEELLENNDFFLLSYSQIMEDTGVSKGCISKLMNVLSKKEIIERDRSKDYHKFFIRIDLDKLKNIFDSYFNEEENHFNDRMTRKYKWAMVNSACSKEASERVKELRELNFEESEINVLQLVYKAVRGYIDPNFKWNSAHFNTIKYHMVGSINDFESKEMQNKELGNKLHSVGMCQKLIDACKLLDVSWYENNLPLAKKIGLCWNKLSSKNYDYDKRISVLENLNYFGGKDSKDYGFTRLGFAV